jgi:hypothetical protein
MKTMKTSAKHQAVSHNKPPNVSAPRLGEILTLLWNQLGSNRLLYILSLLFGLSNTAIMMLFPLLTELYYNRIESNDFDYIRTLMVVSTTAVVLLVGLRLLSEYMKHDVTGKLQRDVTLILADEAQRLPLEKAHGSRAHATGDQPDARRQVRIRLVSVLPQFRRVHLGFSAKRAPVCGDLRKRGTGARTATAPRAVFE